MRTIGKVLKIIHILLLLNQNIFITNLLILMYSSRLIVSFCFSAGLIFKPAVEGIAESINVTIFTRGGGGTPKQIE